MLLSDLPVDVLRLIMDGPLSASTIKLWKCGDRRLHQKLANHGVTDMNLQVNVGSRLPCGWPRILKHLNLISLSLQGAAELGSRSLLQNELRSMKPGLKRLIIDNRALDLAFFDPPSKLRSTTLSSDGAESLQSERFCLSAVFPNLEYLEIGFSKTGRLLDTNLISLLPLSLTSIKCFCVPEASFARLTKLNSLRIDRTAMIAPFLESLPSSLTFLSGAFETKALLEVLRDGPGARWSSLEVEVLNPFSFEEAAALFGANSSTSTNAAFKADSSPNSMENSSLKLSNSISTLILEDPIAHLPAGIDLLPNRLTRLKVPEINWNSMSQATCSLPSTLVDLTLSEDGYFSFAHFLLLPRGLTRFEVTMIDFQRYDGPHLQLLAAQSLASVELHTRKQLLQTSNNGTEYPYSAANIRAIQSGSHLGLPLGLKTLIIQQLSQESDLLYLTPPPHITHLETSFIFSTSFATFPLTITHLQTPVIPIDAVESFKHWTSLQSSHPSSIVPHLLANLHLDTNVDDCSGLFKCLPRTLKRYVCPGISFMEPLCLQNLPACLTHLELESASFERNSFNVTTRWTQYLPRNLVDVRLASAQLLGEDMKDLPPNLENLFVDTAHFILTTHIAALPLSLKRFSGYTDFEDDDNFELRTQNPYVFIVGSTTPPLNDLFLFRDILPKDQPLRRDQLTSFLKEAKCS